MTKYFNLVCLFVLLTASASQAQPFLSNLSSTKSSPIYTVYAADRERSEFTVDQGYQFLWFDALEGIRFATDTGGDLCIAWKLKDEIRYRLSDMHAEPIVTTSYGDLVKYYFYPFPGIRVDVFFLVYSSRIAVQDITVTNETQEDVELELFPLYILNKGFTEAEYREADFGLSFIHTEPPDGWTLDQGVPYKETLKNFFAMDSAPDSYGAFSELGDYSQTRGNISAQNYCVEWGEVQYADGSYCVHTTPVSQQMVFLNHNLEKMLTEETPKWGDVDPNIPGNGFQGCELGNFSGPGIQPGDTVSVYFTCTDQGKWGMSEGIVPGLPAPGGININVTLNQSYPVIPINISVRFSQSRNAAVLSWEREPAYTYNIYRRTASFPGRYDLVASRISDAGYLDSGLSPDSSYGYVLVAFDAFERMSPHSVEVGNIQEHSFFEAAKNDTLGNGIPQGTLEVFALQKKINVPAGGTSHLRIVRGVSALDEDYNALIQDCSLRLQEEMSGYLLEAEQRYQTIPDFASDNEEYKLLYWNAFTLLNQCMLPPEAECSYNYYVFSREPQWGWGHGGQVFHESLSMLAYAFMDPEGAMNSQRVFMERQDPASGYINYRTGPYLNESIPYNGDLTTSGPFFNWQNWEVFLVSQDTVFLAEAYQSGKKFYNYFIENRDKDNDGLAEWGAHAVLESLRDGQVAVWDEVGWPALFECLDLNTMLVKEAKTLALMAERLGLPGEAADFSLQASERSGKINQFCWDAGTKFYYHVDKNTHTFTHTANGDLLRKEIIGFLPLWAGIASPEQAAFLVDDLQNENLFYRPFGVPTLSAADPYYNHQGYWNGPVWVQWQYLVFRGLLDYGYRTEAVDLARRVMDAMIRQLKSNHFFWELYSPDYAWGGWNKTYIWAGIIARMMLDVSEVLSVEENTNQNTGVNNFHLEQNYPNPFNAGCVIEFSLPQPGDVRLSIFNTLGQEVALPVNGFKPAGTHRLTFNGEGLPSGAYFYRLTTPEGSITKKLTLVK